MKGVNFMQKTKRILSVLLAMAMLCGFMMIGVSAADAAEPTLPTDAQMKELQGYMRIVIPIAILELALQRVPKWLNWAAFAKGSSYATLEAELIAELKKAGLDYGEVVEWILAGDFLGHLDDALAYNKVIAGKGPGIIKKHCAFYIGWLMDGLVWANGIAGTVPLFA